MAQRLIDADALIHKLKTAIELGQKVDESVSELEAVLDDVESMPTIEIEPQWIPVSERLPEALEEVLVTSKYGHVYTSRIVHGEFEYGGEVIAWMPLPEPYEGEGR